MYLSITIILTTSVIGLLYLWLRGDYEIPQRDVVFAQVGTAAFLYLLDLPYYTITESVMLWVLLLMFAGFAVVFIVDWRHHLIPNRLTAGLAALAIILCIFWFPTMGWKPVIYGICMTIGFFLFYLMARGSFGMGDVKLAFSIGVLMTGSVMPYLLYTLISGALVSVILLLLKKKKRTDAIAFGPFMVLGIVLVFLFA